MTRHHSSRRISTARYSKAAKRIGTSTDVFFVLKALRHTVIVTFAVWCLARCGPSAKAGLYGGNDPVPGPSIEGGKIIPMSFAELRLLVNQYNLEAVSPLSEYHKELQKKKTELSALARQGKLTTKDALDLSVVLIRLRQYEEAVELLTPLAQRERDNFRILANLACANQLAGRPDRALEYLQQVRDFWPREMPGWSKEELAWRRTLEDYQLRLLKARIRENLKKDPSVREKVDDLFGDESSPLRYQAENGAYEAGKLAATEKTKLPADALAILQQLVIWFPEDTRLYWQLGEMYNAQGDLNAAARIFEECVGTRRFSAAALRAHRRTVQAAKPVEENPLAQSPAPSSPAVPSWMPEKSQLIVVGGIAGAIIFVLVFLQFKELRRRSKQARK